MQPSADYGSCGFDMCLHDESYHSMAVVHRILFIKNYGAVVFFLRFQGCGISIHQVHAAGCMQGISTKLQSMVISSFTASLQLSLSFI